jgi:hypothetical protein
VLFRADILRRIATGEVTCAFRRWRRPTVRQGGTLRTPLGVLDILAVETPAPGSLTGADARAAGHATLEALLAALERGRDGTLHRIVFRLSGPDPRAALRAQDRLTGDEEAALRRRLAGMDDRAPEPWTMRALEQIATHEGAPAVTLADALGMDKDRFKRGVMRLKTLGLTESLRVGYRLSPRGRALLDAAAATARS